MRVRDLLTLASTAGLLILSAGCNHSRYGPHHDERIDSIRRVGILVPSAQVFSLHTGGLLERRADLEPEFQRRLLAAMEEEVRDRNREPRVLGGAVATGEAGGGDPSALLTAVSNAIVTHHYEHGKARIIDYTAGNGAQVPGGDDVDALLCINAQGKVPTTGREVLKGTAIALRVLTGINVPVPTKGATIELMLVDRRTGEVLWFNLAEEEVKVTDDKDLREVCHDACKYLLKSSKS